MAEVRSLKLRLKGLPWLKIAAEFLAIFAGVTLSLAADDWRQERANREMEQEILLQIYADLEADSTHLDSIRDRMVDFEKTVVWLWQHLDDGEIDPTVVIQQFRGLFNYATYQPVTLTYTALKDGGQMVLVRDNQIRRLIVDYFEVGQSRMLAQDDRVWGVYSDLRVVFHRHFGWEIPDSEDSFPTDPRFVFLTSWDKLREDPDTLLALGMMATDADSWGREIEEIQKKNLVLRGAINKHLVSSR